MQNEATTTINKAQEMYETACAKLNRTVLTVAPFNDLHGDKEGPAFYSLHRITTVIEAKNDGREPDYDDYDQEQRFPVWDMRGFKKVVPGSGFRLYAVGYGNVFSLVGARLETFSIADGREIAEVMMPDYRIWMRR